MGGNSAALLCRDGDFETFVTYRLQILQSQNIAKHIIICYNTIIKLCNTSMEVGICI